MITADEYLMHVYGRGVEAITDILVITKGSCYRSHGGRAQTPVFWPFEQGEIVFTGPSTREPFGEGRKPSKWDVEYVQCSTLAEALELSEQVRTAEPVFMPDYKLDWTDEERKRFR